MESDDDVIEVIRDEAPIEILSDGEELERELSQRMNINSDPFDFMSALEFNESPKVLEDPLVTSSIEEPLVPFIVTSTSLLNTVDNVIDALSNNIQNVNVTAVNISEIIDKSYTDIIEKDNIENINVTDVNVDEKIDKENTAKTNQKDDIENVNINTNDPTENVNVTDVNPNDTIQNVNVTDTNPNDAIVTDINPNDNTDNINVRNDSLNESTESINVTDTNLSDSGENINVTDVETEKDTEKQQKATDNQAFQYDTNSSESNVHVDDI